jgi:hypothetical protein
MHMPRSYKLVALVALLLADTCNGRFTLGETPRVELLTASPKSSITSTTYGAKKTASAGYQCEGCTFAHLGACANGATPVCVDASSSADSNLPCVELKLAMTANPADLDTNGQDVVPGWMNRTNSNSSTTKPNTAARHTADPVLRKAHGVVARCPPAMPTKMCCRSNISTNSERAAQANEEEVPRLPADGYTAGATVPAGTSGAASSAACSMLTVTAVAALFLLL